MSGAVNELEALGLERLEQGLNLVGGIRAG